MILSFMLYLEGIRCDGIELKYCALYFTGCCYMSDGILTLVLYCVFTWY